MDQENVWSNVSILQCASIWWWAPWRWTGYSPHPRVTSNLVEETDPYANTTPRSECRRAGVDSCSGLPKAAQHKSLASSQIDISDTGCMLFRYLNSVFWSRSANQPGRLLLKADLNVQSSIYYICIAAIPILGIHFKNIFRMVMMVTQQYKYA